MSSDPTRPIPCPFEHPVKAGAAIEPINQHFHGRCHDCGATGPEGGTFAEALKAWNARRGTGGKQ